MNEAIQQSFLKDLDNIAMDLISVFGIQFAKEVPQLSSPLLRWLDFRLRYIDPQPRKIIASAAFPRKLPSSVESGLRILEKLISAGGDLNSYQSKTILQFHDISSKKRSKRTDRLWADWGIHHLHITDVLIEHQARFSPRTCSDGESWLLFCIVQPECIGLIDVRKHTEEGIFADSDLIRIVANSWPSYMEHFLLKGAIPTRGSVTPEELSKLRSHGINAPVLIDGRVYLNPGHGITGASTSARVSEMAQKLKRWVVNLAHIASDPEGQIQRDIRTQAIKSPELHFGCTPQGLAIFEAQRNIAYTLSTNEDKTTRSSSMQNLLLPAWALSELQSALG